MQGLLDGLNRLFYKPDGAFDLFAIIFARIRAARWNRRSLTILMLCTATLFCPNLPVTLCPARSLSWRGSLFRTLLS